MNEMGQGMDPIKILFLGFEPLPPQYSLHGLENWDQSAVYTAAGGVVPQWPHPLTATHTHTHLL